MDANSKKKITLEAYDADGDSLTFTIVSDPDHGNLTGTAPSLNYQPEEGYSGSDSFRFTAGDSVSESNVATISIFVFEEYEEEYYEEEEQESDYYANARPIAIPQSLTGTEDSPVTIQLTGQDPDEDPLTFEIVEYPLHGELSGSSESGKMTYTPESEFNGTDSFTFVALDHQKESKPAAISIAISAVNDPPVPVSMNLTAADGAVNFTLAATDAEGDPLRFAVYQTPSNGTLIGNAPHLFYAAEPGFAGEDKILFTVSDNRTETWIGVVFIQVGPESASEDTDFENEDEMENEPGGNEPLGNTTAPDTEVIQTDESQPVEQDPSEESTTKARADKSNVLVMVSWDHHEQEEGLASTLHLKFAEHRTREELDSHIWYDLVMLDE
jgi:hypothetical protein